ncbi:5-oxoprolinase subunit PxpB [Luteimonas sp. SJ-92]|uniref:5-oxoprolinase subunit PxpB n=1 Tax=Luteimonas salinisoli TaxID=2752307 RepID=A0A853J9M5_9GAMM|nr:5-oxoprolinase subunit PxpB [Luteimonas salinisoli]
MTGFAVERLGGEALLLRLGERIDIALNRRVHALAAAIAAQRPPWLLDVVPGYASLALFVAADAGGGAVDPLLHAERWLRARLGGARPIASVGVMDDTELRAGDDGEAVEIPVLYGGPHGPDLADVAAHAGLSPEDTVAAHAAAEYRVAMLGFAPGFPYLLGLDPRLAMPRMDTPRTRIPAGSVAIGGAQTGVYPRESPGGWRIVGSTPLRLFDPARSPPSLLTPGQRVRFVPVEDGTEPTLAADAGASTADAPQRMHSPAALPDHDQAPAATLEVLAPGLATTVQGAARNGYRHLGVAGAGALDAYSHAVANLLVGNASGAAALEIALAGPRLRFTHPVRIALCGAAIDAEADGHAIPGWRPVLLPAGCMLSLGPCRSGARAYLAVAGDLAVEPVLGSASTDLRGGFGGLHGRALARGDVLGIAAAPVPDVPRPRIARWWIDGTPDVGADLPARIRLLPGHDATAPADAVFGGRWRVAAASNRQGLRLQGDTLALAETRERVSEPVAPGTVQLPPDGHPIVLLADAQTHGGYPRIGHAIRADWPRLAQLRPGDALGFLPCTADEAHAAACAQRQRLNRIALAIQARRSADG